MSDTQGAEQVGKLEAKAALQDEFAALFSCFEYVSSGSPDAPADPWAGFGKVTWPSSFDDPLRASGKAIEVASAGMFTVISR